MTALLSQTRLEVLEIAFRGAIVPGSQNFSDHSGIADVNHLELQEDQEGQRKDQEYLSVSNITAEMFRSAWTGICTLMENTQMFKLRYASRKHANAALD